MATLYYLSALYSALNNKTYLVAGTSNKCELYVGYFTKGGDSVHDISPIADFTVEEVIKIGKYLKVPDKVLYKAPNDGLSNQTDEDKLGVTYQDIAKYMNGEQLDEIKHILNQAKTNMKSYKLPVTPKNFYVELGEAAGAINDMVKELDKRPISIKTLNTRVDTARDLTLKVYNTTKEATKTARMAEAAIVYGNRYRAVYKDVELGLLKAENAFYKGNFKISLEQAINAINIVEPGIHKKLLEEYQ